MASRFQMGSANFHSTKKDNTVNVVGDFREVNKWIVRKPFPIPKISTVLQELEGFTYVTAVLNIGYYAIRLDPDASKICTIIRGVSILAYDYQWVLHVHPTSSKLRCHSQWQPLSLSELILICYASPRVAWMTTLLN